ncbi:MAG: endonuclease/exonuclease/phosphatase family protein [Verrucomicrobiae bacterium]|nr:endonuclease/exonuclease/phosphatase family protein [Verrucomicrobiae bacterium]
MLRRLRHLLAFAVPLILVLVLLFVLLCYLNRWDEFVVITLIPMWAWAAVGMLVSLIAWPAFKSRFSLVTFFLWLIAGVAISDESAGLIREFHAAVTDSKPSPTVGTQDVIAGRLRVISLNCDDGTAEATAGLKKLAPDIVMLQEAPDRAILIDLTSELFGLEGTFIRSEQCAILARGRLSNSVTEESTGSLVAVLERSDGEEISLVNVHLPRATPCFKVWSGDCREELTEQRKVNRRTLRDLLERLPNPPERNKSAEMLIVGGSFGAPPSDDIYRLLRKIDLDDSFRRAGYGWGNTYPSSIPLLRVDQIWASEEFVPVQSETLAADASDHRFVVTDFHRSGPVGKLAWVF